MKNSYLVNLLRLPTSYISKSGSDTTTVLYFWDPLCSSRYLIRRPCSDEKDLCEFLPIQLNYSTELPQCNLQYCSIINAIRVVLPLSWLPEHLSIPESSKKERSTQILQMSDLIERKRGKKLFRMANFQFHFLLSYIHTRSKNFFWSWCWNWMMGLLLGGLMCL